MIGGWWTRLTELDPRRRGLALVVTAALLMVIGGWVATLSIESPREAAANAGPPAPSLIAVPVERRQVGEELVTRGRVAATGDVEAISPLAGAQARRAVISGRLPTAGQSVKAGQVVVEISGRPIIALPGAVPAYRDLGPGDAGGDVRQLHRALKEAGFAVDPSSSTFGEPTGTAVAALYRRAGYSTDGSLPAGEVVFVDSMPATVSAVTGDLGTEAASASVRLASGDLVVLAEFDDGQRELVRPGTKVEITSEVLGRTVDAVVAAFNGTPAEAEPPAPAEPGGEVGAESDPAGDGGSAVVITPVRNLTGVWVDQDVRVRIVGATTAAKVLAVPLTAIVSNGSGETEVVVVAADARTLGDAHPRRVRVSTGATGGGWVEVRPVQGADLDTGDLVQLSAAPGRSVP